MKRSRVNIFGILTILVFTLSVLTPALCQAANKIQIKFTTIQMPKQQMGKAALTLAKWVKKDLGDKVDMKVFTSAQLYRGKEELEAVRRLVAQAYGSSRVTGPVLRPVFV